MPFGTFGELHIGGDGVARGYHDRAELTAERFVDRPVHGPRLRNRRRGSHPSQTARSSSLGRADNQVKIRGHRIELGEIESVLDEHPAVIQSVVVAQADEGDTRLVAYVVASPASELSSQVLREHVAATLPSIMVPSAVVRLDAFPLTPNGKIDRKALPAVDRAMASARLEPITAPPDDDTEKLVAGIWADELGVSGRPRRQLLRRRWTLVARGEGVPSDLRSHRCAAGTDRRLPLPDGADDRRSHRRSSGLADARTRRPLARRRDRCRPGCDAQESARPPRPWGDARRRPVTDDRSNDTGNPDTDIAIVGMAGRFPGAPNVDELWRRVAAGEDCLVDLSREVLRAEHVSERELDDPDYVARAGVLDDLEAFDAEFFGIGKRDAAIMDPQHRHFMECCWEALETAGHVPERFDGSIGVFAGCGFNTYMLSNLLTNQVLVDQVGMFLLRHTANDKDFLSTTVSYRLDLRGPSINVQTACSTSLVAVHLAVQSLLAFECDIALAGGSTIQVPHRARLQVPRGRGPLARWVLPSLR